MSSQCFVYLNGVLVQPALIFNISAPGIKQKATSSLNHHFYGMVEFGKIGDKKMWLAKHYGKPRSS
jgi:hypothetical protein